MRKVQDGKQTKFLTQFRPLQFPTLTQTLEG